MLGSEAFRYDIFQPLVPQPDDRTADDSDCVFLLARLKSYVEAGSELDAMQKSYSAVNHLSIHLSATPSLALQRMPPSWI
jgi:hypothetical protein